MIISSSKVKDTFLNLESLRTKVTWAIIITNLSTIDTLRASLTKMGNGEKVPILFISLYVRTQFA